MQQPVRQLLHSLAKYCTLLLALALMSTYCSNIAVTASSALLATEGHSAISSFPRSSGYHTEYLHILICNYFPQNPEWLPISSAQDLISANWALRLKSVSSFAMKCLPLNCLNTPWTCTLTRKTGNTICTSIARLCLDVSYINKPANGWFQFIRIGFGLGGAAMAT